MIDLIPAIGLLIVAAITPGPNNFLVFTAAVHGGGSAVVATTFAICAGSLLLFLFVKLGLERIEAQHPAVVPLLTGIGALYLVWVGVKLIRNDTNKKQRYPKQASRSSFALMLFQLVNPKGWVLMSLYLTAGSGVNLAVLAVLLVFILSNCLALWAAAGLAISARLENRSTRVWVDRTMGALLIVFAALLFIQTFIDRPFPP